MTGSSQPYAPHPYVGGRNAALRALAAWRMEWPGAPRVVLLTGSPGTGCSRLVTGFLMLCDPAHRAELPLDALDPATVPPELPPLTVLSPDGVTGTQLLTDLAERLGLRSTRVADVRAELGAREGSLALVVPDVDRAGPVGPAEEPARLVREVLKPLANLPNLRLVVELPRTLATELARGLPPGVAQLIDLHEERWADPEGLVRQAEALLDPGVSGARAVPFTVDPAARHALAKAIVARTGAGGGSRLTVRLAVNSLLAQADRFDPADPNALPTGVAAALDLHAHRAGVAPATLRAILAPLALAEGMGLPVELLGPLASAVAGRDMHDTVTEGLDLTAPFVETVELTGEDGVRQLKRLVHPGVGEAIRAGFEDVRAVQTRIAMTLLEEVPEQDWAKADPYVRDHIASHTLAAGLLPQLLTDPGLFTYADPVCLRAAVESVPHDSLGAAARTYLRTAPQLTAGHVPPQRRAALLGAAFTADGLTQHATALHQLAVEAG